MAEGKRWRDKIPFFGAAPWQRMRLRRTRDKRPVKESDLDMNAVGRRGAPPKVGESIDLIDIAMGEAPAGPTKDLQGKRSAADAAAARKSAAEAAEAERRAAAKAEIERMARRAAGPPPAAPELTIAVPLTLKQRLERLAWIAGGLLLVLGGALPPALERFAPEAAALVLPWRVPVLAAAALALWVGLGLRQLLAFRGGFLGELVRAAVLASGPAALGGGLILWLGGALPSLELAPPAALADPLRTSVLEPLARSVPLPPAATLAAAWAALAGLAALGHRLRRPRPLV